MTEHYLADLTRQRDRAVEQLAAVEAERDGAYRERAQLTAWLATLHPAVLAPAPDVDDPGWQILYLDAGGQQLSWHIHPRDADLYGHVEQAPIDDPRALWDGHTTPEKYERIRTITAAPAQVSAIAELAALHAGEEPYEDDRLVPTPSQWIWLWNRATPEERLAKAGQVLDRLAGGDRCFMADHEVRIGALTAELAARQLPCLVTPPSPLGWDRLGLGPCRVTGPHIEHRDADGATWWERPACPGPVECGHEAALRLAEAKLAELAAFERIHAQQMWRLGGLEDVEDRLEDVKNRLHDAEARIGELTAALQPTEEALTRVARLAETLPTAVRDQIAAAIDGPAKQPDVHAYLSTGCLHGEHGYCQGVTGAVGAKKPASCKFCAAPCRCDCHTPPEP